MLAILGITSPIFMIVLIGYGLTHRGLFSKADIRAFGKFVVTLALPALVFKALSESRLSDIKAGHHPIRAPVYSHLTYDVTPGEFVTIDRPDILIFEGLNVLQPPRGRSLAVSDMFDFSVYVDARTSDIIWEDMAEIKKQGLEDASYR